MHPRPMQQSRYINFTVTLQVIDLLQRTIFKETNEFVMEEPLYNKLGVVQQMQTAIMQNDKKQIVMLTNAFLLVLEEYSDQEELNYKSVEKELFNLRFTTNAVNQ